MKAPDNKEKKCSLCETILTYFPSTKSNKKDHFWKCPGCGAELWPEDENITREIQKSMSQGMKIKKKTGGTKSKKITKKKGIFIPWYQRYRE